MLGGASRPDRVIRPVLDDEDDPVSAVSDAHVGMRVRIRRMELGMSQERLAAALGVTFQQIQKYERGANRIGASRLLQLASALKVPVDWFFDGIGDPLIDAELDEAPPLAEMLGDATAVRLVRAFATIDDPDTKERVISVIEAIAGMAASTKTNG